MAEPLFLDISEVIAIRQSIRECCRLCVSYRINQPFLDGNERTGLTACLTFLLINGIELREEAEEVLDKAVWGFADKTFTKEAFAALLRQVARSAT